jgi:hypothetical protein
MPKIKIIISSIFVFFFIPLHKLWSLRENSFKDISLLEKLTLGHPS